MRSGPPGSPPLPTQTGATSDNRGLHIAGHARPRAERGRRRAGAGLAQAARHCAREAARPARAGAAAVRPRGDPALSRRAAAQHGQVSPELLEAVIAYLGDGNEWAAERLPREPGWVIDSALRSGSSKVFAAHLTQLDSYEVADLRLGKKTEALLDEAATLHKKLDRYAYGAPAVGSPRATSTKPALPECSSSSRTPGRSSSTGRSTGSCPSRRSSGPSRSSAHVWPRWRRSERLPRRPAGRSIQKPRRGGSAAGDARDRRAGARREPRSRLGTDERPGGRRPSRHARGYLASPRRVTDVAEPSRARVIRGVICRSSSMSSASLKRRLSDVDRSDS